MKSGSAELLCGSVTEPWVCAFSRSKKAQIKCKSARSIHWELEQMTRHVVQQKRHFRQSFFGCLSIAKLFRTIVGLSWLTRWRRFCSNVLPTPLTRFARHWPLTDSSFAPFAPHFVCKTTFVLDWPRLPEDFELSVGWSCKCSSWESCDCTSSLYVHVYIYII